jgi:hypothetical protein
LSPVEYREQLLAHVQLADAVAHTITGSWTYSYPIISCRKLLLGPNTGDQGQQQEKHTLHGDAQ